ncbi:MAG: single-stranded-DNA-specific exonuclease RecJ [Candidatus Marinimicrobia bacterium]|nr:single-stranded-DNA-specific exonuclease RecJ [Candidatus Neomarinimicrobiota bacterium]
MYKWKIKEFKTKKVKEISENYNIPPILAKIFIDRNITTTKEISQFLNPEKQEHFDPYLCKDMDKAVVRIKQAKMNNEKVTIYGDYDVDGATSTSLLYLIFQKIGIECNYYIPDRENEGYGLSKEGIDSIKEEDSSLIITCDCGISAVNEIEYANSQNIDVIITDHHTVGDNVPDAFAIINPKQKNCEYPFPYLAGVGVAFKLAEALSQDFKLAKNSLHDLLDLVAIGTAADIVEMSGENRILVAEGLEQIRDTKNPGIRELLKITGLNNCQTISVSDIVFRISPRLNAAGRMASGSLAVNLLTTKSEVNAHQLATHLEKLNSKRRTIEDKTINDALLQLKSNYNPDDDKLFLLYKKNWHKGVLGIVASKLIDKYRRPAIMISVDNDNVGVGSARSIPGFDIYEVLSQCDSYLENFGGHPRAAGLTVNKYNIEELKKDLTEIAEEHITDKMLVPTLEIDSVINFNQINQRTISLLKQLSPFGPANMKPVFVARNVGVSGIPRIVGKNHLKFRATQNKIVISAIGWKLANLYEMLISNRPLDIAFVIEENKYNGMKEIQLNIKDIKFAD